MSADSETQPTSRLQQLRTHSAPRFLVVGGISVVVDVGLLALLHGGLGVALIAATVAAFALSSLVNFGLNRAWTFAGSRGGQPRSQLVRFYLLVVLDLGLTVGIVAGLTAAGMFYVAAKLVATAVVAALNYLSYRFWVFAVPDLP